MISDFTMWFATFESSKKADEKSRACPQIKSSLVTETVKSGGEPQEQLQIDPKCIFIWSDVFPLLKSIPRKLHQITSICNKLT